MIKIIKALLQNKERVMVQKSVHCFLIEKARYKVIVNDIIVEVTSNKRVVVIGSQEVFVMDCGG